MKNIEIIEMVDGNDISNYHRETISEIDPKVCGYVVSSIDKILEERFRVDTKCHNIYQLSKELREMNHA